MEAGHWVLAIREKVENGKHKLYVLDSLGKDSGTRHRNEIANALANTIIFKSFPKGKAFDVVRQVECECGARMAKYMDDITNNYNNMKGSVNIPSILGMTVNWEKTKGKDEVENCRSRIKNKEKIPKNCRSGNTFSQFTVLLNKTCHEYPMQTVTDALSRIDVLRRNAVHFGA